MASLGADPASGLEYVLGTLSRGGYWGWRVPCRSAAGTNIPDASYVLSHTATHRADSCEIKSDEKLRSLDSP
jgi:hypothetical protein